MPLSKRALVLMAVSIATAVILTALGFYFHHLDMNEITALNHRIHSAPLTAVRNYDPETILSRIQERYERELMYVTDQYRLETEPAAWEIIGTSSKLWFFSRVVYKLTVVESPIPGQDPLRASQITVFLTSIASRAADLVRITYFCLMALAVLALRKDFFPHVYPADRTELPPYRWHHRALLISLVAVIFVITLIFVFFSNLGEVDYSSI